MITGKFVSCYSCAGEGSDLNHGSVWGGRGRGGRAGFLSQLSCVVQAEPVPGLEARVLYSLIIFQNYTAITFKIQSWGGFSGWDGGGRGVRGRWGEERGEGRILGRLTSQIE